MGKSFRDVKTGGDDGNRWEEELPFEMKDIRDIAKGEFKGIRLVGYVEPFMRFWVPTEASKAYDPYKTKAKMYPSVCVDFDSVDEEFTGNECLYRKAHFKVVDSESGEERWDRLKPTKNFCIFFIDRERQEERAGIPLKKKYLESQKFSDIQCATVPTAFAKAVQSAIDLHKKKFGKDQDPTDPDEGFDLFFKFDKEAKAEAKYNIQLGDPAPLTKEERKQCEKIPESVNIFPKDDVQKIRESLVRSGYLIVEKNETPEEAIDALKARKAKPSVVREGVELVDDDEDETPRRKRPSAADEDETFKDEDGDLDLDNATDDDDEFNFDEDDDEKPKASKTKTKTKAKAKAKAPAEEEDDDEFNFDDDDE